MDIKKPAPRLTFQNTGKLPALGQNPKVPGAPEFKVTSGTSVVSPKAPFAKGK